MRDTLPCCAETPLIRRRVLPLQVMTALAAQLSAVEAEKQKLRAKVRSVCEENKWLWDELANVQQKLQKTEQNLAQVEVEKEHLEFMTQLKQYDPEDLPEVEHTHKLFHIAHCELFITTMYR